MRSGTWFRTNGLLPKVNWINPVPGLRKTCEQTVEIQQKKLWSREVNYAHPRRVAIVWWKKAGLLPVLSRPFSSRLSPTNGLPLKIAGHIFPHYSHTSLKQL